MNRTTLVTLFRSDSFKRTGSHESFVYESDYTGGRVYDCLCRTTFLVIYFVVHGICCLASHSLQTYIHELIFTGKLF